MLNKSTIANIIALIESFTLETETFRKEESINPSIRELAPFLWANLLINESKPNSSYKIATSYNRHLVRVELHPETLIWLVRVEQNNICIETKMIYPEINVVLNLLEAISKQLYVLGRPITPFLIDKLTYDFLPYRFYYLVRKNNTLARFSQLVLDTVIAEKRDPISAIINLIQMKPSIQSTTFSPTNSENDILLTYLTLRSALPAYLIPRIGSSNNKLYHEFNAFLSRIFRVRFLPLESIDYLLDLLVLVYNKIGNEEFRGV